jgi:integrase
MIAPRWDKTRGKWEVKWRDGTKPDGSPARHIRRFEGKAPPAKPPRDAVRLATKLNTEREHGGLLDPEVANVLVGTLVEAYWRDHAVPNLSDNARGDYRRVWAKWLKPRLGHRKVRELTPGRVDNLVGDLKTAGAKPPTIAKALTMLGSVCRYAVREGSYGLTTNPVREVSKPKVTKRLKRPLTPATVEAIRARLLARSRVPELTRQRDAFMVSVLAYSGARPWEATHLHVEDFGEGSVLLNARKTSKERPVRLLAPLAADLRAYMLATGIRSGALFPAPPSKGEPKTEWAETDWRNWAKRVYRPAAIAEGVTGDLRPYRLRGSFASLMLWEGKSLPRVAGWMGHDIATLATDYAGVLEDLEDAEHRDAVATIMAARQPTESKPLRAAR